MFHDPDFMPFQPPEVRGTIQQLLKNYLTSFPASTYEEPFSLQKNWPFRDNLFVTDPDLIEELLIGRADEFTRDHITRQGGAELDRGSLFLAEGADWRWQRRAVAPAFRHENLLGFVPTFAACAKRRVEIWRKHSGGALDVSAAMTQTTFDIILDAALGGATALDRDRYLTALATAFKGVPWQMLLAYVGLPASFPHPGRAQARRAADYGYGEVAKLVAARKAQPSDRNDVLNLLIAARDSETEP